MDKNTKKELAILASKARSLVIRAVGKAQSGHPGGSLSCMDALVTLYFSVMNIRPEQPDWEDRDRFVLSKGHAAPALYSVLALRGYFPEEDVLKLRSISDHVSGHPDMTHIKGVDMSTGSLAQGLSAACGIAMAAKLMGKDWRTYAICGDGEMDEGQIWEAAMAAAKYKLDNLTMFLDSNGLQIDGDVSKVMPTHPLNAKFRAFNWNVLEVCGHDYEALYNAVMQAQEMKGAPTVIIMHTTKGKGVSYMENQAGWHGKAPSGELLQQAIDELDAQLARLVAEG